MPKSVKTIKKVNAPVAKVARVTPFARVVPVKATEAVKVAEADTQPEAQVAVPQGPLRRAILEFIGAKTSIVEGEILKGLQNWNTFLAVLTNDELETKTYYFNNLLGVDAHVNLQQTLVGGTRTTFDATVPTCYGGARDRLTFNVALRPVAIGTVQPLTVSAIGFAPNNALVMATPDAAVRFDLIADRTDPFNLIADRTDPFNPKIRIVQSPLVPAPPI